jgi:hypothetical protein
MCTLSLDHKIADEPNIVAIYGCHMFLDSHMLCLKLWPYVGNENMIKKIGDG